jgi:hypothetical protein
MIDDVSDATDSKPVWNGGEWTCKLALSAWRDLSPSRRDDSFPVKFLTDHEEPGEALVATLVRLAEDQVLLHSTVTSAMRRHYDSVRPRYVRFALAHPHFMGDPNASMPESPDDATFASLHELQGLFVHPILKEGLGYVGLSFSARWEPEHGLGVMLHHRRVVEVGGADTSFLTWIAEKDLDG